MGVLPLLNQSHKTCPKCGNEIEDDGIPALSFHGLFIMGVIILFCILIAKIF